MRAVAFIALLVCAPASAQPGGESEVLDSEARSIFEAGRTAYSAGRYQAAFDYFSQAYRLSHRPGLLFNMAQAADRARLDQQALEAYRGFLQARPDATERVMVEQRIRDLSSAGDHHPQDPQDPPPDPEDHPPAPVAPSRAAGGSDLTPWVVVISGAAVAIGGGVLLGLGLADRAAVEGASRDTVWDSVADQYGRAPALMITGDILLIAGLAACAAGIVWAVVGSSSSSARARLRASPFGLALQGSFDVALF